jgi:hypothetical protein
VFPPSRAVFLPITLLFPPSPSDRRSSKISEQASERAERLF